MQFSDFKFKTFAHILVNRKKNGALSGGHCFILSADDTPDSRVDAELGELAAWETSHGCIGGNGKSASQPAVQGKGQFPK